jgi:hypothetical protein
MASERFFGRAKGARSWPIAASESQYLPSADVIKGMEDERSVRRLRRRLRFWRLLRQIR